MDRQRLAWVDTGRGVAIILVALYHSARWLPAAGFDTGLWQTVNAVLATLRMPLFFFLAGLFAVKWQAVPWSVFLRAKGLVLAWVFLVWQVVGEVFFFLGRTILSGRPSVRLAVQDILLAPLFPRLELWFLWALVVFFITIRLTRSVTPVVRIGMAAIVSAAALSLWPSYTTGWSGSLKYIFFFVAGAYFRDFCQRLEVRRSLVGILALGLWSSAAFILAHFNLFAVPGLYFCVACLGVVGGICLGGALQGVRTLRWLGRNTLPIYVAHTPAILVIVSLLHLAHVPPGHWADLLLPPAVALVSVVAALLLEKGAARGSLSFLYSPPTVLTSRFRADQPSGVR